MNPLMEYGLYTLPGPEYLYLFWAAGADGAPLVVLLPLVAFFRAGVSSVLASAVARGAFLLGGILKNFQVVPEFNGDGRRDIRVGEVGVSEG
jgi:hypothetical protein